MLNRVRRSKPREIVRHVNKHLVTRARRFVWAFDQSQRSFIEKHMSTALEPTPFFPNIGDYDADKEIVIDRPQEGHA